MIYFQTDTSFGYVSDEGNLPPGATVITEAEYNALVAQAEADRAAQFELEMQQAYQRYRDAYAEARTAGFSQALAMSVAATVGIEPPDFDPTWPPAP